MRFLWAAAPAAFVLCGAAFAGDISVNPTTGGTTVGIGIICDTADQAEQLVSLRAGGADSRNAILAVNTKAKNPRACGVAAVAFVRDATLGSRAVKNKLLQVVRINILAGFNGSGWQQTAGMVQYAVIEGEGEAI
jgi:hypothetical protein